MMSNTVWEDLLIEMKLMPEPPAVLPRQDNKVDGVCEEDGCGGALVAGDAFLFCNACGTVDLDRATHGAPLLESAQDWLRKPVLYKRRQYIRDRLLVMCGKKHSRSPAYKGMVKELQAHGFEDLDGLRALMKELGYHKQYKFVYNVFFDATGVRLVDLDHHTIERLSDQFVALEAKFKAANQRSEATGRKNMVGYSSLIWYLLKQNQLKGHEHVLLPLNHERMVRLLEGL